MYRLGVSSICSSLNSYLPIILSWTEWYIFTICSSLNSYLPIILSWTEWYKTILLQHVRLLINTSSIATSRDQMFQWKPASSSTSERWCLEKLVLSTRTEVLDQSLFGSHKYDQQCNFKHYYLTVFVPVYAFECKLNLSCSGSKQTQQVTKMCI